jgi:hypothetical protein
MTNPFLQGIASGLHSYAQGGIIPAQSDTMPNMNGYYPLSNMQQHDAAYAPKLSFVQPSELLGSDDANIDPFTGEEKFDVGGAVKPAFDSSKVGAIDIRNGYANPFDNPDFTGDSYKEKGKIYFRDGAVTADDSWMGRGEVTAKEQDRQKAMGEVVDGRNLTDIGFDPYGTGGYYNSTTDTDRGRQVGFGGGNEDRLREDALSGGIGPYVDQLNKDFAAAPRYKDNAGVNWGGGTNTGITTNTNTSGTFNGGTGTTGTATTTTNIGGTSGTEDELKEVDTSNTEKLRVGTGTGTGTNTEKVVGGAEKAIEDEEKKVADDSSLEVIDPETGQFRKWDTKTGTYATTGTGTDTKKDTKTKVTAEELTDEEKAALSDDLDYVDTSGIAGLRVGMGGTNTGSTYTGGISNAITARKGSVGIEGLSDRELSLYGGNNDRAVNTGLTDREQNLYSTSGQTQIGSDDYAAQWGMSPAEISLYENMYAQSQAQTPAAASSSKGGFFDWLGNKLKSGIAGIKEHPVRSFVNAAGQVVTGIPGLGTASENAANYVAGRLADHGTGMTDEEIALYGQMGQSQEGGDQSFAVDPDGNADIQMNVRTGPAPPGAIDTTFGPGQLSTNFRGTGDMNAINFLTGGWGGSPTSMLGPSGEGSWYSASSHGDTYAPGQTFASQNKELADYAATHSIGSNDTFADNRAQYFRDHPELGADPGSTANYRSEIGKAEYADQTEREKSAEEQQMLDEYYSKLYGGEGMAAGGLASLPEYKAGGLLHGPGDGMSDSIPAVIKGEQPQRAALADGEFVVPADVVSHLGNGSTKAGSARLYEMMDKIRHARTGNSKQGKKINPHKFLPV